MELQMQKQTVCINELVFDGQTEQPVEADLLLPDYCPDIQRILHCDLCCLIHSTRAEQQRLTVDGELRLSVLYVSDSGTVQERIGCDCQRKKECRSSGRQACRAAPRQRYRRLYC